MKPLKNQRMFKEMEAGNLVTKNYQSMNIWADDGDTVVFMGENGNDADKKYANKYLEVGKTYTIQKCYVGGACTMVKLWAFPHQYFNSVHFKNHNINSLKARERAHLAYNGHDLND